MATTHQETATKLPWANIGLMADPLGVITRKLTSFSTFAGLYAMLTVDEQESFERSLYGTVLRHGWEVAVTVNGDRDMSGPQGNKAFEGASSLSSQPMRSCRIDWPAHLPNKLN